MAWHLAHVFTLIGGSRRLRLQDFDPFREETPAPSRLSAEQVEIANRIMWNALRKQFGAPERDW